MSDFSANLKELRKQANMSQDSLAEQLSVSRQTVSSWERGKSYPDLDMLVRICEMLHVTPNKLLYPSEKRNQYRVFEIFNAAFFQKIAIIVVVIGFLLGISAGSEVYSPAHDTVSWHFVFSNALKYWLRIFDWNGVHWNSENSRFALYDWRNKARRGRT